MLLTQNYRKESNIIFINIQNSTQQKSKRKILPFIYYFNLKIILIIETQLIYLT